MTRRLGSRLTIRTRLALVYGGLFLVAGILMLTVTYGLVAQQLPGAPKGGLISGNSLLGASTPQPTATTNPLLVGGGTAGAIQTRHDALVALLTQGGIALGIVGASAVAFGWLIAGRLLQPLQRMTETARRIADSPAADSGLHERIALVGPQDEIKELADTFDTMIARLDKSFDGQRRFVANASHELRTPLTLNRALLEVAVHRPTASPEIIALGETLLEVNARHERLIDGLLLLTRSEPEVTERAYVDLADIVEHVASQLPDGPVTVTVEAGEAPTTGNPVLLERLVHNLLENGLRYNLAGGGWVRVATGSREDGSAFLTVSNTGPVIPRYEVPALFEPFRRLGTQRLSGASPGAGLGLSIVEAVAGAHARRGRAAGRRRSRGDGDAPRRAVSWWLGVG
jgi:signal transduction histidine kinase